MVENKLPMSRRLKSTILIMISQALLAALAVSWIVHMALIAANGSVYFVENNRFVLWTEIVITSLILVFAGFILFTQIQRLGERRGSDSREDGTFD